MDTPRFCIFVRRHGTDCSGETGCTCLQGYVTGFPFEGYDKPEIDPGGEELVIDISLSEVASRTAAITAAFDRDAQGSFTYDVSLVPLEAVEFHAHEYQAGMRQSYQAANTEGGS